ncbi:MAG: PEP-CTERM sorting domain-containing protein, partial [Armatimonadota bacterium]|nr:PEP-CTERM sorting domain-containing protein [Armatimonadota bacterium]
AQTSLLGTVLGGYITNQDVNQDRMTIIVNNLTLADFTDVTLNYNLPASGSFLAVTGSFDYGTISANGSRSLDLSVFPDFGQDPAHTFPDVAPFDITVTANDGGTFLSTDVFNQDTNTSGGFVGFEGIGEGANAPYLPVAPTQVGILAPVPEASTTVSLGLLMLGLGGLALRARRRA